MNLYFLLEYIIIDDNSQAHIARQFIPQSKYNHALALIESNNSLFIVRMLADNLPRCDTGVEAFDEKGSILPGELQILNSELYADEIEYLYPIGDPAGC